MNRRPLVLVGIALAVAGCNPYGHLTESGPDSTAAAECGGCHVEIHREWQASAHATAWTNEAFAAATSARLHAACLGCHAPESIHVEGEPILRATRRDEGVDCVACHLVDGALAGPAPASALVEPHPIATGRTIYLASELCGKCHEGTLAEWRAAPGPIGGGDKRTCQECHMPVVERTLTQATDAMSEVLVAFEDEHAGRRHTFHLDAVAGFVGAIEARLASAEIGPDGLLASVAVVGRIEHRIPTGDFGFRRIAVTIEGLDADGERLGGRSVDLFKEHRTALEPGVERTFEAVLPASTASVRLRVERAKGDQAPVPLHEQAWPVR